MKCLITTKPPVNTVNVPGAHTVRRSTISATVTKTESYRCVGNPATTHDSIASSYKTYLMR